MGLSAAGGGAGTGTPTANNFKDDFRRIAAEVVNTHENCDLANPGKCDLYHHLIEILEKIDTDARYAERAPMICGHPTACVTAGGCMACLRETRLLAEAGRMSHG